MNLFEYIKFQTIDVDNPEDLYMLPEDLILLYWSKFSVYKNDHKIRCAFLSMPLERISHTPFELSKKQIFQQTLKEYYEIHHEPV